MAVLYLQEQGIMLKKVGNRIAVTRQGETLMDLPVFKLDRILIFGNVQVSTQALGLLLEQGIDVAFFSFGGRLRGTAASTLSKNIFMRLAQYAAWQEPGRKLNFARCIVAAKIQNQAAVLQRYQWRHGDSELGRAVKTLQKYLSALESKENLDELSGLEGIASRVYFSQFGLLLRSGFQFQGRSRRPPTDPVNALLSLGYSLLTAEFASLLEGASFDPYLGFLHGVRYGRQSLALDLVEQFRQPVIDLFTLTLCNKKMFDEADFTRRDDGEADGAGYYLTEKALKRYFSLYEENLRDKKNREMSWRDLINRNVESLGNAVLRNEAFVPFVFKP